MFARVCARVCGRVFVRICARVRARERVSCASACTAHAVQTDAHLLHRLGCPLGARRLCLRVAAGSLVRVRATRPQGDATVMSRTENVRGVFALRRSSAVRGRDVLLVDDVFTTGATARGQ